MNISSRDEAGGPPEATLAKAWAAARAAWPGVELPLVQFVAHASARLGLDGVDLARAADLYLAAACLAGNRAALDVLERVFLARIGEHVCRINGSPAFADDVRQALRERLLVGRRDERARLADYAGRGPLGGWLRVVAVRIALDLVATQRAQEPPLDAEMLVAAGASDPEHELLHARYGPLLRQAVGAALTELTSQQRNLLRLNLGTGLSTAKIATAYHVDQSTVVRWLQAARAAVRDATYERLRSELGASTHDVQRLATLLLSRLDLSLSAILHDTA